MSTEHYPHEALDARFARLERAHKRQRVALIAVGAALASLLLMGQAPVRAKSFEANAFVLLDDTGRDRAQLTVNKDGAVALLLKNNDGLTDTGFAILPDGSVSLRMRNPRKSAALELSADGVAAFRMNEKYAKSTIEFGIDSAGRPRFVMTDPEGKAVHKAP